MPTISPGQDNVSVNAYTGKSFGTLPDLSVTDDTSLEQIQQNYNQIGSDYNKMVSVAAKNVGARQRSLVGNDFGATNPYMYDTYYEPAGTSMASKMRMEGTQQAFETGMERGKKAAEQALEDAKKNYSNAVDSYNNMVTQMRNTYKEPAVAYFDGSQLGEDTEMSELLNYAKTQGMTVDEVIGKGDFFGLVKDWGEVGKSPRRTEATNATLSKFGYTREEYDKWDKAKQDEFWGRADVGNYWSKQYADSYIKDNYSQDIFAQYQKSYDDSVKMITDAYNAITGKTDKIAFLENDMYCVDKVELDVPTLVETERVTKLETGQEVKYIQNEDGTTKQVVELKPNQMPDNRPIKGQDNGSWIDQFFANTLIGRLSTKMIKGGEGEPDKVAYDEFAGETERVESVKTLKVDYNDLLKKTLGVDSESIYFLKGLQKNNEDTYNALVHQASSVIAGANALDIADGEKWYLTSKGYEQLPEGTVVMFTPAGTMDENGQALDQNLNRYLEILKELNDPAYSHTKEQTANLMKEAEEAYSKYYTTMTAALQWETMAEAITTEDAYHAILYRSDPTNKKYQELTVQGKPIKDIINEWNVFAKNDPEKAYRMMTEIVNDTWQEAEYYFAATPEFGGPTKQELKPLKNEAGRDAIGKEGEERVSNEMTEEIAGPLFQILTTSIEQYRAGKRDGNINPGLFMDKDTSGWFENTAVKLGKDIETIFNLGSNAISTLGKIGSNFITGDWEHTFSNGSLSFQQLSDAITGRWDNFEKDATSWEKMFTGKYDENSWSYYYDVRNEQQENMADVFNPLIIGEMKAPMEGIGRGQTARGVGFWENPTAIGNFTSGVVSMLVGNAIENVAEDVVLGSAKLFSAYISQKAMTAIGSSVLNKLDDTARGLMTKNSVDALVDTGQTIDRMDKARNFLMLSNDDFADALLKTSKYGGKLSLDYSDDLIRSLSYLADAPETAMVDVNKAFASAFKASINQLDDVDKVVLKDALRSAGKSIDNLAAAVGSEVAGRTYRNLQIATFTGVSQDVLANVPDSVQIFASRAIAANVARDGAEAIVMTSPSAGVLQIMNKLGGGYGEAVKWVSNMGRNGLKKTLNDMFTQAASYAKAGLNWGTDDTLRFLARNGWGEQRTALLRNNWLKNQLINHTENMLYQMSQPQLTDDGSTRTTPEEYLTNPMNYIMATTASGIMIGGQKMLTRAQMAATSKSLNNAYNAFAAAENKSGAEAMKAIDRINKLQAKQAQLASKALDAGLPYDKIQEYTNDASEITQRAWGELESKTWLNVAQEKGYTKATDAASFIKELEENKIKTSDQLFLGSRIAVAETPNRYYNNKTALGGRTNGLATVNDTETLLGLNRIDMNFRKSHRFTEIKNGPGNIFDKMIQYYKELRALQVAEYGHINGLDSSLDHYYNRLVEDLRDLVKRGKIDENNVRLGYEPIGALLDPEYKENLATRGLIAQRANPDVSTANPALMRGIDQESILDAIEAGKTQSELRDINGDIIEDAPGVPHIFDINAKGLNYLDRLSYYENSIQGHRILDSTFGRNDQELGATMLKNNDALLVAPKAGSKMAAKDYQDLTESLQKFYGKIDAGMKAAGVRGNYSTETNRMAHGITEEAEKLAASNDGRVNKIAELAKQRNEIQRRIRNNRIIANQNDPRALSTIGVPTAKQAEVYEAASDRFSNLAELSRQGKLETIYRDSANPYITIDVADGMKKDIEITDSLFNQINNYVLTGGAIPQDAVVYLALAEDMATPYKMVDGVKKFDTKYKPEYLPEPAKKVSAKSPTEEAWKKTFLPSVGKKGMTQGKLSKYSATTDTGEFDSKGMWTINNIIGDQLKKKLPKGANGERMLKAIQNYTTTIVKDIVSSTGDHITFSDVVEIVDAIAPDAELILKAKDTGLLQALNSLDKSGVTLGDLSDHLDFLIKKAAATNDPRLAEITSAYNLVRKMQDTSNRAKTGTDFKVNVEDFDDEKHAYSGPTADITGRAESDLAVSTWDSPIVFTRDDADKGIASLYNIIKAMKDPRDANHSYFANDNIANKTAMSAKNRDAVREYVNEFNKMVKGYYDSGKYPELNKRVDDEVAKRLQRQTGKDTKVNHASGNDYAAAFGVARPDTGYNRVDSQGQLIRATMSDETIADTGFDEGYSKTRLAASTYGGHANQVLEGYYELAMLLDDADTATIGKTQLAENIQKFLAQLPKEQQPGAKVLGSDDNFENSLMFALGEVEDPTAAPTPTLFDYYFTPGYTEYGSPSSKAGKKSMFTDEQMTALTYGRVRNPKNDSFTGTNIIVDGQRYTVEAGFELAPEGYKATGKYEVTDKAGKTTPRYTNVEKIDGFSVTVYDSKGKAIELVPPEKVEPELGEPGDIKNADEYYKYKSDLDHYRKLKKEVDKVINERYQNVSEEDSIYRVIDDSHNKSRSQIIAEQFEDSYEDGGLGSGEDAMSVIYTRYLNSKYSHDQMEAFKQRQKLQDELDTLQKQESQLNKEIEQTRKQIDSVKKTNISKEPDLDVAKKYLSKQDYAEFKKLYDKRADIKNAADAPQSLYRAQNGAVYLDDANGLKSYISLDNLKKLFGWEPDKAQPSSKEILESTDISKADKKAAKKLRKDINKHEGGKGLTKNVNEEFDELWEKLPKSMDSRSKGLTLNQFIALEEQLQELTGVDSGNDIYISKDMAQMLTRIADTAYTPSNFSKFTSVMTGAAKWIQEQQMAGGFSFVNALSIVQIRDAIKTDPFKLKEYIQVCADMKNSKAVADWSMQNMPKLTEIALASHDTTLVTDLSAAISANPGVEDGGVVQNLTSRILANKDTDWKGPKAVLQSINGMLDDTFGDATFQNAIPVLRAKMAVLEYDKAVKQLQKKFPTMDKNEMVRHAAELSYARVTAFFEPTRILTPGGLQGFLDNNYIRQKNIMMNDLVGVKNGTTTKSIITGDPKTETFMSKMTNIFFAMRYKMMLTNRVYTGLIGAGRDLSSLKHIGAEELTAENFNRWGTKFMSQGAANGIYSMMGLAAIAMASCYALDIPTAWDDIDFVDEQGNPQVPAIWQKFQTIGQIWLPNAYDPETGFYVDKSRKMVGIDTMSSTFTLQNSLFKTADRIINPNNWSKQPQRGLPFLGVNNPINKFLNSTIPAALGDELFASNLLSPYKAMYEIIMDTTYFGNNIWEKKYLPDGTENKNYDPMRNTVASVMHLLGLEQMLDGGKGYNAWVKGKYLKDGSLNPAYVDQDRIGTVGGSGILQHEFVSAALNFLDGEYLEGITEAGELPLKTKNLSSQARTEFNNKVKNTIAQYMAEYKDQAENASAETKDTLYAKTVQKCADVVASWSAKWDYIFGDDQTLVPYATRVLMAITAGEYDDNLAYLQNAIWKAEDLTNIEHGSWSWLSDEDLDQWIADGHTVEEFNAEKKRRTDAYNRALDDEYTARQALKAAGYSEELLEPYRYDDIKAAARAVNRKVFTSIQQKLESPVGEFKNFSEMKKYYEAQIDATTSTKTKASLAKAYNKYVTDVIAPYVDPESGYGATILTDGYYNGENLANTLSDYIILPADQYYRGKTPRASYLKDLFGVGYKNGKNLPSDDEIIELFSSARTQIQKGATASAAAILDRAIEQVKKGNLYASDADYSKIVRLKALLGARS